MPAGRVVSLQQAVGYEGWFQGAGHVLPWDVSMLGSDPARGGGQLPQSRMANIGHARNGAAMGLQWDNSAWKLPPPPSAWAAARLVGLSPHGRGDPTPCSVRWSAIASSSGLLTSSPLNVRNPTVRTCSAYSAGMPKSKVER